MRPARGACALVAGLAGGVAGVPLGLGLGLGERFALLALAALGVEHGGGLGLLRLTGGFHRIRGGLLLGGLGFGAVLADLLELGGALVGARSEIWIGDRRLRTQV